MADDTSAWKPVDEDTSAWKPVQGQGQEAEPGFLTKVSRFVSANPSERAKQPVFPLPGMANTNPVVRFVNAPFRGQEQMIQGARGIATPGERLKGTANVIEGAGKQFTPFVAQSLLERPLATAAGGLVGGGLSAIGQGATEALGGSPELGRVIGDVAPIALGGPAARAAGRLVGAPAARLAEAGMGIRPQERGYGATPGKFILERTSAWEPGQVGAEARSALDELDQALAEAERGATGPANIAPAISDIRSRMAQGAAGGSRYRAGELEPLESHLAGEALPGFKGAVVQPPTPLVEQTSPILGPKGEPITRMVPGTKPPATVAPIQPAPALRNIKREFGEDFTRFNQARPASPIQARAANEAYHELAKAYNAVVPGAEKINQAIQSGIPVEAAGKRAEIAPGTAESILGRLSARTGALLAPLFGLHVGGIPGAALATAAQEAAGTPSARIGLARGLYGAGRGLRTPQAARGARALPLILDEGE